MATDLITTKRLRLHVLTPAVLDALADDPWSVTDFVVPPGWPDADDTAHLERWRQLAIDDGGASQWRARAVVDNTGTFVGHAGFHGRPIAIERALADATYDGEIAPCQSGAVEIGYTILPACRGNGYATEAIQGLLDWARATGEVGAVIACVRPTNTPSLAVLARVGGFEPIGHCRDDTDDELVFRRDL